MTRRVQPLGILLHTSHHNRTFAMMSAIFVTAAPVPCAVTRATRYAPFTVTFYDARNLMQAFAWIRIGKYNPGFPTQWRALMMEETWPVSRADLERWLFRHLDAPISERLFGQLKYLSELQTAAIPLIRRERELIGDDDKILAKHTRIRCPHIPKRGMID